MPTPHLTVPSLRVGLDVGDGGGVGAGADGVLAVVDDVDVDAEVGLEGGDERGDRAAALAGDGPVLAVDEQLGGDRRARGRWWSISWARSCTGALLGEVLGGEGGPDVGRARSRCRCPR